MIRENVNVFRSQVNVIITVAAILGLAAGLGQAVAEEDWITSDKAPGLDDSSSPIRTVLLMERLPRLNEAVTVVCRVTSFVDAPATSAHIELPTGATVEDGLVDWHGSIAAGETISFSVHASFAKRGDQALRCRASNSFDSDNSIGDLCALYMSIAEDDAVEGYAPVNAEQSRFALGVEVREPGNGEMISLDQWKKTVAAAAPAPTPPAPPAHSPLRPGEAALAGPKRGDLTVTGRWSYFGRDDASVGMVEHLVEAVRGDNDGHLAWCYTDLSGYYYCGPFTNPGAVGVRTLVFTQTSYYPNSDLLVVQNPDSMEAYRVGNSPAAFPDGVGDLGSWNVINGNNLERAYWAQQDLNYTWRYIHFTEGAVEAGPCTVLWKIDSTDGDYYLPGGSVRLTGDAPLSDTVVIHEYSHNIMYSAYGDWLPPTPSCNPHSIPLSSSKGCAWVEGWAEFVPMMVNDDPYYRWADGSQLNLETPTWQTGGWNWGDTVEGRVAGALWDMHDSVPDGDDLYSEPLAFDSFWDLISSQTDITFYSHWSAWQASGFNNSSGGPLMSIYQNTVNYRIGPPNDDFSGAPSFYGSAWGDVGLDTTGATTQGSDPDPPCGSGDYPKQSRSVWYRFVPPVTGQFNLNTEGSDYDTVLAVWTGSFGSLSNAGCDDDGGTAFWSNLDVALNAGTAYYVEVTRYGSTFLSGGGGSMTLSVNFVGNGLVFEDGFESGNLSAWSTVFP